MRSTANITTQSHIASFFLIIAFRSNLSITTAFSFYLPAEINTSFSKRTTPKLNSSLSPLFLSKNSESDDASSSSSDNFNRDHHVALLDRSLCKHTSLGILENIQAMYEDGKANHSSEKASSSILSSLPEIHTDLRFALVSHGRDEGTIDGALHNYANFGALSAFRTKYDLLTKTAARKMAQVGAHQYELEDTLRILKENIDGKEVLTDYSGFRCTKDQNVFYIRHGLIWNCYDDKDEYCGQALLFDREKVKFM